MRTPVPWPDSMFPGALPPCLVRSRRHGCSQGAGPRSTVSAEGVAHAQAGKTGEWTRTHGFSLCCYHVNPRTYRTTSVFGGTIAGILLKNTLVEYIRT